MNQAKSEAAAAAREIEMAAEAEVDAKLKQVADRQKQAADRRKQAADKQKQAAEQRAEVKRQEEKLKQLMKESENISMGDQTTRGACSGFDTPFWLRFEGSRMIGPFNWSIGIGAGYLFLKEPGDGARPHSWPLHRMTRGKWFEVTLRDERLPVDVLLRERARFRSDAWIPERHGGRYGERERLDGLGLRSSGASCPTCTYLPRTPRRRHRGSAFRTNSQRRICAGHWNR